MLEESKIFKNEDMLNPEYLPELLPHRENQIKQLADNLLPASKGRRPQNTFVFGPPGIGKTVSAKFVFKEFENYSGIKTFYINCWDYKSSYSVLSKIAVDLGAFVQRRGMSKDEILEKLSEAAKKTKNGLIICLDEVDQLIFNEQEVLYDLLRINQYIQNPVGIIFISNNPNVFLDIEPRIKSSLSIEELEFKSYSLLEMKEILQERAKHAFKAVEEGVVMLCANHAVNNGGDVRIGLECLLKAGRVAEQENSSKVKVEHVKKILSKVEKVKPKILEEKITDEEKIIVEIAKQKKSWMSGELYKAYAKKSENPVTDRAFRHFINHLADTGMIKVEEKDEGMRGKTRIISIA